MKENEKKEANSSDQKISFLNQLIESLEKSEEKLEEAYIKENHEKFKITREFMIKMQQKISETLK